MGVRIDILKRRGAVNSFHTHEAHEGYEENPSTGVITRKEPKKPSRYALHKNTKRARKFAAFKETA